MASKLIICLVLAAFVGCAMAQYLQPIAGARDLTGGYYDNYSGQYSSAITGRVYNTAPAVVAAPAYAARAYVAPSYTAPLLAHHTVAAPVYSAPVAWIRR